MQENIKSNTKVELESNFETSLGNNLKITPKRDIVFKRIFGVKGNEGILKDFLEAILDIKIESLELDLATEMIPEFYDGKKSRIDVRTKLSDGTEVNIEMQMDTNKYSEKRCLYYWGKMYSNTLKEKENYKELRKTICIWILNGKKYNEFKEFHSKWKMMNCKYKEEGRFGDIEFHVIELKKLRENDIIEPTRKEFWLWFIDHTSEELVKMASVSNEEIRKAREELNKIRGNEELMHRILLEELAEMDERTYMEDVIEEAKEEARAEGKAEGRAEGRAEGKAEGKAEGLAEGKAEALAEEKVRTAKSMLEKGLDIELIIEITGLSREKIEELK